MDAFSLDLLKLPELPALLIAFSLSGDICAVIVISDKALSFALAADCRIHSPMQTDRAIIVIIIPIKMLLPFARTMFLIAFLIVNMSYLQ